MGNGPTTKGAQRYKLGLWLSAQPHAATTQHKALADEASRSLGFKVNPSTLRLVAAYAGVTLRKPEPKAPAASKAPPASRELAKLTGQVARLFALLGAIHERLGIETPPDLVREAKHPDLFN